MSRELNSRQFLKSENKDSMPFLKKIQRSYQRRAARLLFKKPLAIHPERPLISFSFDDFPQSALRLGGAILRESDLLGTYYVSLGLMNAEVESGRMFELSDLNMLREQGHELGCHTFSHCHSGDTDTKSFERAIIENQHALHDLFPGAEFKTFSYPISSPRPWSKKRASSHFLSCRGGGQTFNHGTADLNNLSAYFLEKSRHDINLAKDMIDRNRQAQGWLIFATHDISDNPTPYGCAPGFFEQVVRYAVDSGAKVLPVLDALRELGIDSGTPRQASLSNSSVS
jgi:peptidoglycan/xylan/chitin deacetylase (PgdA/CDA1 family)